MDLRVRCLVERDRAREAGDDPRPLCFDEDRRSSPPTQIRVEYRLGMPVSESIRGLSIAGEAAHFLVEATGSIYQVLDLAHAPRRDGALRSDEIRVLSGNTGGTNTLVEALATRYGDLPVEQVELPKPTSAPSPPRPGSPGRVP